MSIGYEFTENSATRRYFSKFAWIIEILGNISRNEMRGAVNDDNHEHDIIIKELKRLSNTFDALSMKYLFTGLVDNKLPSNLSIDTVDSGFPVFKEILTLQSDIEHANERYNDIPRIDKLKRDMVDYIFKYKTIPRDLQFMISQKQYYDILINNWLFMTKNKPTITDITYRNPNKSSMFLVHWSVYDTTTNYPNIYIMIIESNDIKFKDLESTIRVDFEKYIMQQSLSTLKMITIAQNIDTHFVDLHPTVLKRMHIGPMYSNSFTEHNDDIQLILESMEDEPGKDWVFSWTTETLLSKNTKTIRRGVFGEQVLQVYYVDKHDIDSYSSGSTSTDMHMVLPYSVYQKLSESPKNPLNNIVKHVVDNDGNIISHI